AASVAAASVASAASVAAASAARAASAASAASRGAAASAASAATAAASAARSASAAAPDCKPACRRRKVIGPSANNRMVVRRRPGSFSRPASVHSGDEAEEQFLKVLFAVVLTQFREGAAGLNTAATDDGNAVAQPLDRAQE